MSQLQCQLNMGSSSLTVLIEGCSGHDLHGECVQQDESRSHRPSFEMRTIAGTCFTTKTKNRLSRESSLSALVGKQELFRPRCPEQDLGPVVAKNFHTQWHGTTAATRVDPRRKECDSDDHEG